MRLGYHGDEIYTWLV